MRHRFKLVKMRNFVFSIIILSSFGTMSQPVYFPYENHPWGGSFQIVHTIDFETPDTMIMFDHQSLWQVGTPQKNIFTEAWSVPNALLTDTISSYPVSTQTSFQFGFAIYDYVNFFISFNQRVDVAAGDSCLVEFSGDGFEWFSYSCMKKEYDSIYGWQDGLTYYITDLNTQLSHVPYSGKNPVFTDTTIGWEQHSFWFLYVMITKENTIFNDSLFVRFRFVSDQFPDNRDGWMLDNFYIGIWMPGDDALNDGRIIQSVLLYPNPSDGLICFEENRFVNPVSVSVFDLKGENVHSESVVNNRLNLKHLPEGLYMLYFLDMKENAAFSKLQILR